MGNWDNCARGTILSKVLGHDAAHTDLSALDGLDFVINDIGSWGVSDFDSTATPRLDIPYGRKVPCLWSMWVDYGFYSGAGIDNQDRWPKGEKEPHLHYIDRALFFDWVHNGQRRYYHGGIFDMCHNWTPDKKTKFTSAWIRNVTAYLDDLASKWEGQPIWDYFSDVILQADYKDDAILPTAFSQMSVFQPMSCRKYIPVWADGVDIVVNKFSEIPNPPDDVKPDELHSGSWAFWHCANKKFKINGVKDANGNLVYVPLVLYKGGKKELYKLLNFTAPGDVTPPDNGGDTPPDNGGGGTTTPIDLSGVYAKLDELKAELKADIAPSKALAEKMENILK